MSDALTVAEAARMMRDALRDRSYRATPLGLEVARYYRWKKNEWGATAETLRDYEATLARTALFFADLDLPDFSPPVGTDRLRECWDNYWGHLSPRTRAKVRSTWIDFFEWAVRERGLHGNPARALAAPKKRDVPTETFPPSVTERIITAQMYPADIVAATLILRYGLRRGGIVNAQRRHFDFERRLLTVHTKGGRIYPLPLPDDALWLALGRLDTRGTVAGRPLAALPARNPADARRAHGGRGDTRAQWPDGRLCERHTAPARAPANREDRAPVVVPLP